MKTRTYHHTNLGSFAPRDAVQDSQGYIAYHDSPRYGKATDEQLLVWSESPSTIVRNAALTEIAERALEKWRQE